MNNPSDRTLILGLGNPTRSDDGVGVHVVESLRARGVPAGVHLEVAGTAGLGILDLIAGFDRVLIVDAIDAGLEPGTAVELGVEELRDSMILHGASSHESDVTAALALGRELEMDLPEIRIVAVQVADVATFCEQCTPRVAAAIDEVCERVLRGL